MSIHPLATSASLILLMVSGALAQEASPLEKYQRLREGFRNSGYSTDEIKVINDIAGLMYLVNYCPPEEGRDDKGIPYMIEVFSRGLAHSKQEIESRARELVPAMVEVLAADPAEKANVCGPTLEPQDEPKR